MDKTIYTRVINKLSGAIFHLKNKRSFITLDMFLNMPNLTVVRYIHYIIQTIFWC